MCMEHSVTCRCGRREASFNFKNEIMPPEVIESLYCPDCAENISDETRGMLKDNGWIIHYDMEIAGLYCSRLPVSERDNISPETLFDEGYATWRGVYPGDHIDSIKEKLEITKLAKTDPPRYFREIKAWAVNRMARLRDEGWRKAHDRE